MNNACYIPAALALIAEYHKGSTRSLATGIHMSGLYAGLALRGLGEYYFRIVGLEIPFPSIWTFWDYLYRGFVVFSQKPC